MAAGPEPCGDLLGMVGAVLGWANLVVVVRPGRPEARIHVNSDTAVTVDGRRAQLADVRPGQRVRIRFDVVGDAPVAMDIAAERA
jgi:hypothetical protein